MVETNLNPARPGCWHLDKLLKYIYKYIFLSFPPTFGHLGRASARSDGDFCQSSNIAPHRAERPPLAGARGPGGSGHWPDISTWEVLIPHWHPCYLDGPGREDLARETAGQRRKQTVLGLAVMPRAQSRGAGQRSLLAPSLLVDPRAAAAPTRRGSRQAGPHLEPNKASMERVLSVPPQESREAGVSGGVPLRYLMAS